MDVRLGETQGMLPDASAPGTPRASALGSSLEPGQIAVILDQVRCRELRIARGFKECHGLSREQIEDLYQETVLALLHRPYQDEKHLRDALRTGIKRRALNLYRDERRRQTILANNAPAIHAAEQARSLDGGPEQVALERQDRLVITEFLAELTLQERRVFWLLSEGMKYNRIAKVAEIPVKEARSTVASCERKRERFQLLHDSGRLCGYRAATIKALLEGRETSEQLVALAVAHLEACPHCRAEHKTNAQRLRRAFQEQAAALLPPNLIAHLGLLTSASIHARTLTQRLRPDWLSIGQGAARERAAALLAGGGASEGQGAARERAAALLAGGGASAKLAAGIVTAAVIAGSTITATHALEHHPRRPHPRAARTTSPPRRTRPVDFARSSVAPLADAVLPRSPRSSSVRHRGAPGHVVPIAHQAARRSGAHRDEPAGFAYLGVPSTTAAPAPVQQPAKAAAHSGGPFSP